jgi:hypothetical protein
MSDNVLMVLIVAAAVVVVLFIFRDRLTGFRLKANQTGVETELTAQERERARPVEKAGDGLSPQAGVDVSENVQVGERQEIRVRKSGLWDRIRVRGNKQLGRDQKISVEVGDSAQTGQSGESNAEAEKE